MSAPYCSQCKTTEGSLLRYAFVHGKQYFHCRPCHAARLRDYRKTDSGKSSVRRSKTKYEQTNPLRRRAWIKARAIPLRPCERCGATERVHRHHDDVSRPLDVMFLCPADHKARHRELEAMVTGSQMEMSLA